MIDLLVGVADAVVVFVFTLSLPISSPKGANEVVKTSSNNHVLIILILFAVRQCRACVNRLISLFVVVDFDWRGEFLFYDGTKK